MIRGRHTAPALLWETAREFLDDDCPRMAAALSFYVVLSLPPLLSVSSTLLAPTDA